MLSPFALESYGRRENQQTFMKEIAKELFKKQLSTEDSKFKAQLLNRWWIELSCTLHKGRAMFILSRSFRILESKHVFKKIKHVLICLQI